MDRVLDPADWVTLINLAGGTLAELEVKDWFVTSTPPDWDVKQARAAFRAQGRHGPSSPAGLGNLAEPSRKQTKRPFVHDERPFLFGSPPPSGVRWAKACPYWATGACGMAGAWGATGAA